MSIESVMPSNYLILCPSLLLPSIFPSIRVFSSESVLCIRWPKYWNFSFSISPSNEYSGLISFRIDWLDLLAVQRTLKSLQHHISKASILQCSDFFIVQISNPYMTTGKTMALTRWTFVGKVMSLLFNKLSRLLFVRNAIYYCKLTFGFGSYSSIVAISNTKFTFFFFFFFLSKLQTFTENQLWVPISSLKPASAISFLL